MIDSYAIGVSLTLQSNVGAMLDGMVAQFKVIDELIKETRDALQGMVGDLRTVAGGFNSAVAEARKLRDVMRDVADASERTGRATGAGVGAGGGAGGGGGGASPVAGGSLVYAPRLLAAPSPVPPLMLPSPYGYNPQLAAVGGGAGGGQGGIPLNMPGGGGGGGGGGLQTAQNAFSVWGMLRSIVNPVEEFFNTGLDVAHERTALQMSLGGDTPAAKAATERAEQIARRAASNVPGTTVAGNIKTVGELKAVFGDVDDAEAYLEKFLRMEQALKNVGGHVAERGGGAAFLAAQALEARGATSGTPAEVAKRLDEELTEMTRVQVATGGRIDPAAYLQYTRQARAAGMNLTPDYLYRELPAVMLGMGAFRAGTGTQSAFMTGVVGRTTEQAAAEGVRLGLVDPAAIKGKRLDTMTSGMLFGDEMMRDPVQWVIQRLMPALAAHGITSQKDELQAISKLFPNRTGAGFMIEIERLTALIDKERKNIGTAAVDLNFSEKSDPRQQWRDISAAWTNFAAAFSESTAQGFTAAVRKGAGALNWLTTGQKAPEPPSMWDQLTGENAFWRHSPLSREFWINDGGHGQAVEMKGTVNLDGQRVGDFVAKRADRQALTTGGVDLRADHGAASWGMTP